MSDGRNYATWQPGSKVSDDIKKEVGIKSNWQYRKYMVENADAIMKYNQLQACDECCGCTAQYGSEEKTANQPFLFKSCNDLRQPFGYESSDLKKIYLDKYNLQNRMVTPVLTQEQLLRSGYKNYN
jgi:hypothetical protein